MDAAAELGRNPVSTRFSLSMEISRLARAGTAETVSRDQILRHERGQGNIHFPCSADHEQDWQSYPVDPYSCYMCDHTYIPPMPIEEIVSNTYNRNYASSLPPWFWGKYHYLKGRFVLSFTFQGEKGT